MTVRRDLAGREASQKMRSDVIFRYSSLTKTIVAAATMTLVDRGVLQLDDPVTRRPPTFRPKLANGEEPRLELYHVLTHTAGLTYAMFQPEGGTWNWGGAYGHHWFVDPVNRLTVVALTNTALEGMVDGFVSELRNAVYVGA